VGDNESLVVVGALVVMERTVDRDGLVCGGLGAQRRSSLGGGPVRPGTV
jgi:hypothetical protein